MFVITKSPGEKIDTLLQEKDWSQNRLAEESGVNQQTIHKIIHGSDPQVSTVKKIADGLGVPPEKLI